MLDLLDSALLILGQLVFKLIFKLALQWCIRRKSKSDVFVAQGVQLHEPSGQLFHFFTDFAAGLLPLVAAKLIELDADAFFGDEAADQMKL